MGLFDMFRKKEIVNDDLINAEIEKWENFCKLEESFKEDIKLKPIYYLKLYGRKIYNENIINSDSDLNFKIKEELTNNILKNIKQNYEYEATFKCIIKHIIRHWEIKDDELNNQKIIEKISSLDRKTLEEISNLYNYYDYYKMKEQIKNLDDSKIREILDYLIKIIKNNNTNYKNLLYKYSTELITYIYNLYDIMMNNKFELYSFNDNNIYFYEEGHTFIFNEDENNFSFIYKKISLNKKNQVEKYLKYGKDVFEKRYREIILDDKISDIIKDEFNIYQHQHPFYTYDSKKYGKIEFCLTNRDYMDGEDIEVICDKFEKNIFEKVIFSVDIEKFNNDEVIKELIKTIEKAIDMKEIMLDKMYDFTLETCDEWEEKDERGNKITKDYIKKHLSKITVYVDPECSSLKEGKMVYEEIISFSAYLLDEEDDALLDALLGGHEIVYSLSGNEMYGSLNG